jgi:hypothetical protein
MTVPVIFSAIASGQVDEIDVWWRANRPAAPTLFGQELQAAMERLAEANLASTEPRRQSGAP